MADYKLKKAYKHKEAGQVYRAELADGSTLDIEAANEKEATKKIDDHLKHLAEIEKEREQQA